MFCIVGPDTWAEEFPIANDGLRQSPINIISKEAKYDSSLKHLKLRYDPSNAKGILNNGHSFQVDFVDDTDSSSKHVHFCFHMGNRIRLKYQEVFPMFWISHLGY